MSGMTPDDARLILPLVKRLREETPGARKWDDNGIWAELVRCQGHNLQLTIERFARHAGDPKADSPGAVRRPFLPDAPVSQPASPPKAEVACRTCGKEVGQCTCPAPKLHLQAMDPAIAARGAAKARELLHPPAACAALQPTHTDTEESESA